MLPLSQQDLLPVSAGIEDSFAGLRRNVTSVDCHVEGRLVLALKPNAFRRCLDNLLANAVRYGRHVWVRAGRRGETVEITIDDDGPGLPEAEREGVFRSEERRVGKEFGRTCRTRRASYTYKKKQKKKIH